MDITQRNMREPIGEQQFCDGDSGGTGAVDYHTALFLCFFGDFQCIDDTGKDHDGGSMLVIVEYGNIQ